MTTLVLSDLHLGLRSGRDLLRRASVRARLLERLDGVDRVVLLGDAIELRHAPLAAALDAARPFFAALGAALGDAEVVLVPGNHDHRLLAGWHERRRAAGAPLGLEHRVEPRAGEPAALLAAWLAPARLTLAYPGVWLRPDVYATHGHYLDAVVTLPTLERLAIGAMARLAGRRPPCAAARPGDYEAALAPLYAWLHELAQAPGPPRDADGGRRPRIRVPRPGAGDRPPRLAALGPALPLAVAALNAAGLGPLRSAVGVGDLERAGLAAMGQVCASLGLGARHVVFGHLHRAGPRPGDDPERWIAPTGARLVNTGTWVLEPRVLDDPDGARAYRPGTAVRLGRSGRPQVVDMALGGADLQSDHDEAPGAAAAVRHAVPDDRGRADRAGGDESRPAAGAAARDARS